MDSWTVLEEAVGVLCCNYFSGRGKCAGRKGGLGSSRWEASPGSRTKKLTEAGTGVDLAGGIDEPEPWHVPGV